MSAASAGTIGATTAFISSRRRSNSLNSHHSATSSRRRRKGYAEHVSRLQLILATTGVLIPCGILLIWQQIQLQSLNDRILNLEERVFDDRLPTPAELRSMDINFTIPNSRQHRSIFSQNDEKQVRCLCPPGMKGERGEPGPPGTCTHKHPRWYREKVIPLDRLNRRQLRHFGFLYSADGKNIEIRGLPGPAGPKGGRGFPGFPGPIGLDGPRGKGDKGERGPIGPVGPPGMKSDSSISNAYAPPRQQYTSNNRASSYSTETMAPIVVQGPPGPPGKDGVKGDRGLPGFDGESKVGPTGQKGEPGKSLPGYKGEPGIKGSLGMPGRDGIVGPRGFPGQKGDKGESVVGQPSRLLQYPTSTVPQPTQPPQTVVYNCPPGQKGDRGDRGAEGKMGVAGIPGLKLSLIVFVNFWYF